MTLDAADKILVTYRLRGQPTSRKGMVQGQEVVRSLIYHLQTLYKQPETIEYFFYCTNTVFFWDVLERILQKEVGITQHTIRFF